MKSIYLGHIVLEQINATSNKVYAIYTFIETNLGVTQYRVYSKFGLRDASELQVSIKKADIPTLGAATKIVKDLLAEKISGKYKIIHFNGWNHDTTILGSHVIETFQSNTGSKPLNPIVTGALDDRRGIPHPQDVTKYSRVPYDLGFDWSTNMPIMLDTVETSVAPSVSSTPGSMETRADKVKSKMQQAMLRAHKGIRDECKHLVSPFDPEHPLIPKTEYHLWPGIKEIKQMAYLWETNSRVLTVGPAGCGKTARFRNFCHVIGRPMLRINLNGHVTPSELIGKYTVKDGATQWIDGALPYCMKNGYILLIDEIDMAEPSVLALLHPVLESDGELLLKEHDSEIVFPHPEFRLFATANSLGIHDEQGIYTGTNSMNAAFLDRWEITKHDYLSVEQESAVLCMYEDIPYSVAEGLAKAAKDIRIAILDGSLTGVLSTRRLMRIASAFKRFNTLDWALDVTIRHHFTPAEATVITEAMQRSLRSEYSKMDVS